MTKKETREYNKKYQQEHREEIVEKKVIYYKENKTKILKQRKQFEKGNPKHFITQRLFRNTKCRANRKNITFSLDKKWLEMALTNDRCNKTGLEFIYKSNSPYTPSIDRIDSSKGYTKNNCQLVCTMYNFAKNKYTYEDVLKMSKALIKESKKRS